jgi:acetyl-CoA carboxylase biotin carboxyl carrier protein
LDLAKKANLEEVAWEEGSRRVMFVRRAAVLPVPVVLASVLLPEPLKIHYIFSPMVGTFRRALRDRPALVVEGGEIAVGEKVGLVEAMNVPKDVVSDIKGRILRILVENGKPTEYGQKLFEVEPL